MEAAGGQVFGELARRSLRVGVVSLGCRVRQNAARGGLLSLLGGLGSLGGTREPTARFYTPQPVWREYGFRNHDSGHVEKSWAAVRQSRGQMLRA